MRPSLVTAVVIASAGLSSASAFAQSVVIREIFPGGSPSATYGADFVVLFNRSNSPVSLSGWTLQSGSGPGPAWQRVALPGIALSAGQSFLVRLGGGSIPALPTADATATSINLSTTGGVLALMRSTPTLVGCPVSASTLEDLVGFGTATCGRGVPTAAPGLNQSLVRQASGCQSSGNEQADFVPAAPTPRNRAAALEPCGGVVRTLRVEMVGPRTGVVESQPVGLTGCDGSSTGCTGTFPVLSTVTLVPTASTSLRVIGWSGAGTGFAARQVDLANDATVGVSFACWADVTGPGGPPVAADGDLTIEDFLTFLTEFGDAGGCPGDPAAGPCNLADLTGPGGPPVMADGDLTIEDFLTFLTAFGDGCP